MRRVAITGYGIQSCLGNTREEVAGSLEAGRSGIVLYPERKALGFRSALGGALRDPPELPFPRKTVRQMAKEQKVLPEKRLTELLDPWRMTEPGGPVGSAGG